MANNAEHHVSIIKMEAPNNDKITKTERPGQAS